MDETHRYHPQRIILLFAPNLYLMAAKRLPFAPVIRACGNGKKPVNEGDCHGTTTSVIDADPDLDERLDSEDVRLEIDRCYWFVGSTLVRARPPATASRKRGGFLVKLGTRRYLRAEDEGADELWNDVMERWFYNELYKVSNNMLIYNRRQREVGNPQLVFDWIDVELQNGQLHALLHCDNVSGIRPETSELLTQLRAAYNEGALGEDVVRAYLPAPAS